MVTGKLVSRGSRCTSPMRGRELLGMCLGLTVLAAPAVAGAQPGFGERVVWRGLLGGAGIEIRAGSGVVLVGAAGDSASVSVTLRASEVRRFADSLVRRLAQAKPSASGWKLRLEEPGVSAGALSVSPAGLGPDKRRRYRLFVSDDVTTSVQQVLDATDLGLFARKLREAAGPVPRAGRGKRPPVGES